MKPNLRTLLEAGANPKGKAASGGPLTARARGPYAAEIRAMLEQAIAPSAGKRRKKAVIPASGQCALGSNRALYRIALLAALVSPPAIGCAPRTPAPSVDDNLSRRPTASRTSAATTSDSVSWLHVRTDSGVILAAVARPSGVGPFPALIILHGTHGFAEEYVQLARDMARHGVIGIAACWFGGHYGAGTRYITPLDCPGAPPFVDVPSLERFRLARKSLAGLVDAVRTLPDVQRDHVAIFGHSRGGGAALDFVLQHSGTVNAAILNSAGYPPEVAARASEVDVPILLLHGTADSPAGGGSPMTNVARARAFEAALRSAGKPVEAVYYDGSGHEAIFTARSQYQDAVQRIARFLHDRR